MKKQDPKWFLKIIVYPLKKVYEFSEAQTGDDKMYLLYTFQELARFIVQLAREHYLLPPKKLAPESSIEKNE